MRAFCSSSLVSMCHISYPSCDCNSHTALILQRRFLRCSLPLVVHLPDILFITMFQNISDCKLVGNCRSVKLIIYIFSSWWISKYQATKYGCINVKPFQNIDFYMFRIRKKYSLLLVWQMHSDDIGLMPWDDSLNLNICCFSRVDCGIIMKVMKQVLFIESFGMRFFPDTSCIT